MIKNANCGAHGQQQDIVRQMPYLHCGLGESFQPGLKGLVVSLFYAREICGVLEMPPASQELRCELHPQVLPTCEGVGWESVPPPEYFAREGSIEKTTLNGIRIAISACPRGVSPHVVRRIPSFIEQAYLRQPETFGDWGIEKVLC